MKKKISIIMLIVSLLMIGTGGYMYFNNTKNRMLNIISNQINTLSKKQKLLGKSKIQFVTSASLKQNDKLLESIDGDIYVDQINSKFYLNMAMKLANEVDSESNIPEIYIENNKLYFKEDNQVYYIDITEKNSKSISSEMKELEKVLKNAFIKETADENFSREKVNTNVINNKMETVKYSVFLTSTDIYKIIENVLGEVETNKKLSTIKENVFELASKKDILNFVNEILTKSYGKNGKVLTYSIYMKDKNVVKQETTFVGTTIDNSQSNDLSMTFSTYEKKSNLFDYEFIIKIGSQDFFEASINSEETTSKISAKSEQLSFELDGTITKTDKGNNVVINAYNDSSRSNPIVTLMYEYNEVKAGSEYNSTISIIFNDDEGKTAIDCKLKILEGKDVPSFDTSSAKKYSINYGNLKNNNTWMLQ